VCDAAHEHLPALARQRLHWSVPDPARAGSDAAFEAAYADIADRIDHLAPVLNAGADHD
jgi:ArsR family transcriptional regulator, arsenate/arsenite/antimonite-responsive transcriptional repressor / arsenate reductase (thioredoxin)